MVAQALTLSGNLLFSFDLAMKPSGKFSFSHLQQMGETICGRAVDERNFAIEEFTGRGGYQTAATM